MRDSEDARLYYPLMLDLKAKPCLVVGGGTAAFKRIRSLLEAGAKVTVVAPQASDGVREMADLGKILWEKRNFRPDDLEGKFLVLAMSDDPHVNADVERRCRSGGIMVCCNSAPTKGDVMFPSVIRRGSLTISVSTGGKSPSLSRMIREELEKSLDERLALLCEVMGEAREELRQHGLKAGYEEWREAIDETIWHLLEDGRKREAERFLLNSLARKLDDSRHLLVWGINHKTSSLQVIEELSCTSRIREETLRSLKARLSSVVLLDTCNRFEIISYSTVPELVGVVKDLVESKIGPSVPDREYAPYLLKDREALRHLLRVACGLDSLIPGEDQIRSQVRKAIRISDSVGALRNPLRDLLREVMSCARELCGGREACWENSVMGAAVSSLLARLLTPQGPSVLVIGTGQAGLTALRLLRARGIDGLVLVGSDPERLLRLSRRFGVPTFTYDRLKEVLLQVDGVISASSRRGPLLERKGLAEVMIKRGGRPLVVVDIAVPRDFPRDCQDLEGLTLLGMEDLGGERELNGHLSEIEQKIEEEANRIFSRWQERRFSPITVLMRKEADDVKERALEDISRRLGLSGEDRRYLEERLDRLMNQALHKPIQLIKAACGRLAMLAEEGEQG